MYTPGEHLKFILLVEAPLYNQPLHAHYKGQLLHKKLKNEKLHKIPVAYSARNSRYKFKRVFLCQINLTVILLNWQLEFHGKQMNKHI